MALAPGGGVILFAGRGPTERLRERVAETLRLLDDRDRTIETDPLAAAVGLDGPREAPADPALARLLPAGYRDDDSAAAEFRRFTEMDLLRRKRENARVVAAGLTNLPGVVHIDADAVAAWLGTVNDIRLLLGTRLELTDDDQDPGEGISRRDPRYPLLDDYRWLTDLQDRLVAAMSAGLPEVKSNPEDEQALKDLEAEIARRSEDSAWRRDPGDGPGKDTGTP